MLELIGTRFRAVAYAKWNLDAISPAAVEFVSRAGHRQKVNAGEIMSMLQRDFPDDGWTSGHDPGSIEEGAPMFSGLAYVFAAHGAHLYNLIFAKAHSGYCEIQSKQSGESYWNTSGRMRLDAAFVRIPEMDH